MFTGIIFGKGRVVDRVGINDGVRLVIQPPVGFPAMGDGASIAVNGVCLTAVPVTAPATASAGTGTAPGTAGAGAGTAAGTVAAGAGRAAADPGRAARFHFDAVGATLEKTQLGRLNPGDYVNLEAGLKMGDSLDGHLVTGHVDGLGTVVGTRADEGAVFMEIEAPPTLQTHLAACGSIAVDGVSLTLAAVDQNKFTVSLIPFTLEQTTLGERVRGDKVHLETDILAKYVLSALENRPAVREGAL